MPHWKKEGRWGRRRKKKRKKEKKKKEEMESTGKKCIYLTECFLYSLSTTLGRCLPGSNRISMVAMEKSTDLHRQRVQRSENPWCSGAAERIWRQSSEEGHLALGLLCTRCLTWSLPLAPNLHLLKGLCVSPLCFLYMGLCIS